MYLGCRVIQNNHKITHVLSALNFNSADQIMLIQHFALTCVNIFESVFTTMYADKQFNKIKY